MEFMSLGDTNIKIGYSLADLVKRYFGVDLSEGKAKVTLDKEGNRVIVGDSDSWRLNYEALEDMPVADWPDEAVEYAIEDAVWARAVYIRQEEVRNEVIKNASVDPFAVLHFKCAVDFALAILTARGVATDASRVEEIERSVEEELSAENLAHLIESGILEPAQEPKPYANGARKHADDCADPKTCNCPPAMTGGKKEKINKGKLAHLVEVLCKDDPDEFTLKRTVPSDKFPEGQVSADREWLDEHAWKNPVLAEYAKRQSLQKIVTTELPRMMWEGRISPVVHPNFDVLKATGRTSSFAGKLYPSFNCQNVDPRVRRAFVPRAGFDFFSIDYSAMELGTFAQTCINLFGFSKLGDIINKGIDPHGYLGAQIALHLDEDFRTVAEDSADISDMDSVYGLFKSLSEDEETHGFFKRFRTFAKPTGLGYPGGLGPKTFIQIAKIQYGIEVDLPTATLLRDIWMKTFPEAREFFDYINNECVDDLNGGRKVIKKVLNEATGLLEEKESYKERYKYESPMGMWRMACDYCAACNGLGLQTPSAEGATLALYELTKETKTPTSELHNTVFPLMFIHDEIVGEIVRVEPKRQSHLLSLCSQIMVDAMEVITPDVKARAEPVLMTRWDKYIDPVYDDDGFLVAVDPDEKDKTHG